MNQQRTSMFPGEIVDLIIDFLHDDKPALRTCTLVCKFWLPASRYHLSSSATIRSSGNADQFLQLLSCPHCTLQLHIVHLDLGTIRDPFFTPRANQIGLILRLPALHSLRMTHLKLVQNALQKSLHGFKAITVLQIISVRLPTYGHLLDILVAIPLLESLALSEIQWNGVGNIPAPRSFQHLRYLNMFCDGNLQIIDWLSNDSPLVLTGLSIRARSTPQGDFLRTLGRSLEHLTVKMSASQRHDKQNEIMFFNSANLSLNTNLRTVTIDTLSLHHVPLEVDVRFPSLIAMLSSIASPSLDTITLNLAIIGGYPGDVNNVPWYQLANIFTKHSSSLRLIHITLPDIAQGERHSSAAEYDRWIVSVIGRRLKEMERLVMAKLEALQLHPTILAIIKISYPYK